MSEQQEAPAKRSRLPLVLGAALVLTLGCGAGAAVMYLMGGSATAAPEGEEALAEGEAKAEGEAEAKGEGEGEGHAEAKGDAKGTSSVIHGNRAVVNLGTFTVNLRGSGGGRVLRSEVQVEVSSRDTESIEENKPVLRDAVITLASDFTYADLEGIDGKTHLRDELLGRLNTVLEGKPTVDRLYFTEFVVQ